MTTFVFCLLWANRAVLNAQTIELYPGTEKNWRSVEVREEARAHAKVLWGTVLTRCGTAYYYSDSGLTNLSFNGNNADHVMNGSSASNIMEYRGVHFYIAPLPAVFGAIQGSPGAKDIGITFMLPSMYRSGDTKTRTWQQLAPGPYTTGSPMPVRGTAQETVNANLLALFAFVDPFASGWLSVHMQEREDGWYYQLSDLQGSPMMFAARKESELLDSDSRHRRTITGRDAAGRWEYKAYGNSFEPVQCGAMPGEGPADPSKRATLPPPSADEASSPAGQASAFDGKGKDGFVFLTGTGADRQFRGTADEFAAAFPGMLERAVSATNLHAADFSRETQIIQDTARKCAAIAPQLTRAMGNAGLYYSQMRRSSEPPSPYCFSLSTPVTKVVRPSFNTELERGLSFGVYPEYTHQADGSYAVRMRVQFTPKSSDHIAIGNGLLIVSAELLQNPGNTPSRPPAPPPVASVAPTGSTLPVQVCYSVFPDGRCLERSGEWITSPADLASIPDWGNLSAQSCITSPDPVEIHLRAPERNPQRKRYVECIGAVYLKGRWEKSKE